MRRLTIATTLLIAAFSNNVLAWGQNGHRIVGQLAEAHLTDTTKNALVPLLEGDSLAEVSTWADEMRSAPGEFWQRKSVRWHYINVTDPKNMHEHIHADISSKEQVQNILDGFYYTINVLKSDKTSIDEKRFALRFLVHLVGDSHQPFHAGRADDHGGNKIKVEFFGENTNLHSVWDTHLVENENLSFTEFTSFIQTKNPELIAEYLASSPADWLIESNNIAEKLYNAEQTEMKYQYVFDHMPIVKTRLQQGGVRLAGLLNLIFDASKQHAEQKLSKPLFSEKAN
ncbi:S1/P1 nuclease [Pseudoalteromonas fenneropenaei]|uniref:S1/P1 nuclease n=1 Tax=Pseudoalteromonas fenneropenaei TaxID=1737459 RepID=A0ABV7CMW1_9GAMM